MQLNFSQQMRMSQQMKLAPRMIQSMEILQLPYLELQERIEQELEENVCLIADVVMQERSDTEKDQDAQQSKEDLSDKPVEQQ